MNRNEKTTFDLIEVNGTGTVHMKRGYYRDVFVYGYFERHGWWFIVHSDATYPECVTVSEASVGRKVCEDVYYTVDDALYYVLPFIDSKRLYFATTVGDILVQTQCNLLRRNTTNLQTLAIDTALWM